MAVKKKSKFVCSRCGHEEAKWLGKCPGCGEWNSLVEESVSEGKNSGTGRKKTAEITALERIRAKEGFRTSTGIQEFDRVLGGGLIAGSSVLIGGEPGIGKSTLLLQTAASFQGSGGVLYVSGEESREQIKMRAERLRVSREDLWILTETRLESVLKAAEQKKPSLLIIDSIQTMHSEDAGPLPGTVNQIKFSGSELSAWAKMRKSCVFFVAHITKEGSIAGPKLMEHMVDTVLYFEDAPSEYRFLRSSKNRFGSSQEIGIFSMGERGLEQVADPSSLFLINRSGTGDGKLPPGVVVTPVYEGSRVLLVEIQALTVTAKGGISRTFSDRIDNRRVSRIAAVLEKHAGTHFSDQDIYVNVAGGIRIHEVGVELPLAAALYSAQTGIAVPPRTAVTGEVSLAGEIRPVSYLKRRVRTAAEMGFSRCIGPSALRKEDEPEDHWERAATIEDCLRLVFGKRGS
jgi:DNA repair protein RadA/Sms